MKKLWFVLAILVCMFASCRDDSESPAPKPEQVKTEIAIDSGIVTNGLSFSAAEGEQSISFSANANWTLSVAPTTGGSTWCKASATSGSKGTANVKFTVTENTEYDDRSVSVTIKAGTVSKTFTITQKGADAMLLTTTKYEVAQEGGQIEIEVKANVNYQMEISEDAKEWITESSGRALTAYKHKLDIALNESTEKREGEITFKSGDKVETVKVYQAGGNLILLSQNEYTVSRAGGTISVDVKSNVDYGVQMPDVDWIVDEASSRGMSSHTLKYFIAVNESHDSRSAEIIFYDKNSDLKDTLVVYQQGILPETDYVDLKFDSPNVTVSYDENDGSLTMTYPSGVPDVKEGNAIVLPAEYGFGIRVIESVSRSGNTLSLKTSQGNMANLFRNTSFTLTTDAEVASRSANSNVYTPVAYGYVDENGKYHEVFNESRAVYPIEQFEWEFEKNYNGEKIYEGRAGTISWDKCEFSAGLKGTFTFDFGEKTIDEVRTVGDLKRIDYRLTGHVNMDMLLHYKYEYEHQESGDGIIKYNAIPMGQITFNVMVAGVYVPVHLQVYTHLGKMFVCQIEGKLDATAGVKMGNEVTVGLEWTPEGGARPIKEVNPTFGFHPLTVNAEASAVAKVSYYPQWEIGIYGFKAIWLEPRSYLKEAVGAGFRASTDDENYIGWKAETYNGMDLRLGLETEFGFWRKDVWTSEIYNVVEDKLLFEAPSRITTLSPENNITVEKGDSVGTEFIVESFSPITNKYYPCPWALINFEPECGELDKPMAMTGLDGKAMVSWTPNPDSEASAESRSAEYVERTLTAKVVDKEGKSIDEATLTVKSEEEDELREALIKLYQSTNGDNWTRKDNWCSDKPVEEWYGISCENGKYNISLGNNNLTGKISGIKFPESVVSLNCSYNQLTALDVSGSASLTKLICGNNKLTTIDISGCTSLENLDCGNNRFADRLNQLTTLDVSDCTALKILNCGYNQLTALDVSKCTSLTSLDCGDNQLTALDVSGSASLTSLDCGDNQLTALDVSGSASLTKLICSNNKLTTIDVSGCTSLENLDCGYNSFADRFNQLTNLDVSDCTALKILDCGYNQLTALDVSSCTSLESLYCDDNQFTSLDVSICTSLKYLHCNNNQLASLNVSGCMFLERLQCKKNQLLSLDVSSCTSLLVLLCDNNQLTSLDVSNCTSLLELWCEYNQLTALNVSDCTVLKTLVCIYNQITSLDVSGCTSLESLACYDNQLTSLDVSGCTSLEDLNCGSNQLTSLDVSSCTSLEALGCANNQLTSLDVSSCTSLKSLGCYINQLTSLDVSSCTSLKFLSCENNKISMEIPGWFSQLEYFFYDIRYRYYIAYDEVIDDYVIKYEDKGYGWWYSGEPGKGKHEP